MGKDPTDEDALAASTAILAAVSQPNPQESNEAKREFGTVAYERVLAEGECQCVERTGRKLQALDNFVHVWVRDARSFRHGLESSVPYFSLRVASSIPVSELRVCRPVPFRMVNPLNCMSSPQDLVQKRFSLVSSYRKQEDGDLQLCFDDQTLEDEETFSAYLSGRNDKPEHNRPTNHRQPSWPKPFAGILWVLPWRPSRKHPLQWGDGDNSKARQEAHTGND